MSAPRNAVNALASMLMKPENLTNCQAFIESLFKNAVDTKQYEEIPRLTKLQEMVTEAVAEQKTGSGK